MAKGNLANFGGKAAPPFKKGGGRVQVQKAGGRGGRNQSPRGATKRK